VKARVLLLAGFVGCGSPEPPPPAPPPPLSVWDGEPAPLDSEAELDELRALLTHFLAEPEAEAALVQRLEARASALADSLEAHGEAPPARVRAVLLHQVVWSLRAKAGPEQQPPLIYDAPRLGRTVLDWEAFRMETYVSAGVFPKRYFGFLDRQGDTASLEGELLETAHCAAVVVNTQQESRGSPLRVSDAELIVTFLAEGGAMLLTDRQRLLSAIHPIHTLGMDDLAVVLLERPELAQALDSACGTDLLGIVRYGERGLLPLTEPEEAPPGVLGRLDSTDGRWAWLVRHASFAEGIAGTALMWIWEKELTAEALADAGRVPLAERDPATAFVHSSLVYNSGALHDEDTVAAIVASTEGPWIVARSDANAHRRDRLPVRSPEDTLRDLLGSATYREQDTSWLAAYHIAQRYGAWQGLLRFTDHFDESGMLREHGD
jgi:hypothetical protein